MATVETAPPEVETTPRQEARAERTPDERHPRRRGRWVFVLAALIAVIAAMLIVRGRGGLVASTLLTLVVIPTIYEMLEEWKRAFAQRFGVARARHTDRSDLAAAAQPAASHY